MRRLAVIPSEPIELYINSGFNRDWIESYYNPLHFFDEVYLLSPLEDKERFDLGMTIIPTKPSQLNNRIKELKLNMVRAYGGYWACDMACYNKVNGVPVVVSVHDTNPTLLYDSIRMADVVFCVSETVKKIVLRKFKKPNRVWVLPNRVNFSVMHPYDKTDLKDLDNMYPFSYRVLHVGRKEKQKNLDTVIKALKILGSDYCLLAVGKGHVDMYTNLAEDQNVSRQCFFIESIPNDELARYYSWADCMCTPSRWEGFGIVFIEALACEAIVVTSDIAPMNEYVVHGKNGLLVKDFEDPVPLARMIEVACKDRQLRMSLKINTRKSVQQFEKSRIDKLEVNYYKKAMAMAQNGEFNMSFWEMLANRSNFIKHPRMFKNWISARRS